MSGLCANFCIGAVRLEDLPPLSSLAVLKLSRHSTSLVTSFGGKEVLGQYSVMARVNRLEAVSNTRGSGVKELGRLRICWSFFNGIGHSPALQLPDSLLLYRPTFLHCSVFCSGATHLHSRNLIGQHQFVLLYLMSTRSCEAKTSDARMHDKRPWLYSPHRHTVIKSHRIPWH